MGLTVTAVPLVAAIFPGVITPVPLANTPVSVALCPAVIVVGLATKLVIVGSGFTVTVTVAVTAAPLDGVTVSVYVVVAAGVTVTAVPLTAAMLPGVITPVPFAKIPVSIVLCPAVIVAALVVKLVMEAAGGGGVELDEPPQPDKPARLAVTAMLKAKARSRFIGIPVCNKFVKLKAAYDTAITLVFVHSFPKRPAGHATLAPQKMLGAPFLPSF